MRKKEKVKQSICAHCCKNTKVKFNCNWSRMLVDAQFRRLYPDLAEGMLDGEFNPAIRTRQNLVPSENNCEFLLNSRRMVQDLGPASTKKSAVMSSPDAFLPLPCSKFFKKPKLASSNESRGLVGSRTLSIIKLHFGLVFLWNLIGHLFHKFSAQTHHQRRHR